MAVTKVGQSLGTFVVSHAGVQLQVGDALDVETWDFIEFCVKLPDNEVRNVSDGICQVLPVLFHRLTVAAICVVEHDE